MKESQPSRGTPRASQRVCAVVVTYKRQHLLRECLSALLSQSRAVDEIVVVDNASHDGTLEMLRDEFPGVQVLALPENDGGAGGFHDGMAWAHERGFEWLWLMDDDGRPAPDCLEKMLRHAPPGDDPLSAMVPLQQDSDGRQYGFFLWQGRNVDVTEAVVAGGQAVRGAFPFAFVGPLISRGIVDRIGLPNRDFFIWFDDWEYALRIRHKTRAVVIAVPDAVFYHDFGGKARPVTFLGKTTLRSRQPPWKTYYEARNQLYTFTRTRRRPRELMFYARNQIKPMIGDILFEDDRWERVRLRLKGVWDGAMGRLGKRVAPISKPAKASAKRVG